MHSHHACKTYALAPGTLWANMLYLTKKVGYYPFNELMRQEILV